MKKKSIAAIILACALSVGTFAMTGCDLIGGNGGGGGGGGTVQPENVAVTGVAVSPTSVALTVGGTQTLSATVSPSNASNKGVSWSSSNTTVATVSNGVVTAKAVGTATITVTTADGNKTATCSVTVSAAAQPGDVRVTGVAVTPTSATLTAGETKTLTATVSPSNATNKNINWSSNNTTVATVSGGVVTAKAAGTAEITATTVDGGKTAKCTVTVNAASQPVKQYTVKFYSDGTLVDTQTVNENGTASAPAGLSKDGFILSGWAKGSETGSTFDLSTPVTADISLYAKWTKITADSGLTYSYAGNETAAFEWGETNAAGAKVEYKLSSSSSYTTVDSELIRQASASVARVDVVGLKGGATYDFKITTSGKKELVAQKQVYSYDRSGYAHFGKSDGVGAYNNDGTPKSGANIVYVTEATKNTVKATIDGKTYTGIVSILQNAGTKTPLIVRVIGTVGAATWNELVENNGKELTPDKVVGKNGKKLVDFYSIQRSTYNSSTKKYEGGKSQDLPQATLIKDGFNTLNESKYAELVGLNSKAKYDASKDEFDSCWNDCSISGVKNVTVEGIGEDALIFQWGFTFKNSSSIEVRNLHFDDYTEDGCSFEGSESSASSLSGFKSGNIWLHHNTFDEGMNYWDVCNEQDKHDGDGSTDFKGLKNITIAYNHYRTTHKTNLIGGDSHATANVTFHHNYYQSCSQRMPLGRQANMHMYNNYYSGSTLYSISLRAGAYAFIENCAFTEDASNHYPLELVKGSNGAPAAKIINCDISTSKIKNGVGTDYLYVGTDRTKTVNTTGQRFAKDFDTDASLFYYENGKSKVEIMFTAAETKKYVPSLAGVQKHGGDVTLGGTGSGGGSGTTTPDPIPTPDPTPDPGDDYDVNVSIDSAISSGKAQLVTTKAKIELDLGNGVKVLVNTGTIVERSKTIGGVEFSNGLNTGGASKSSNQRHIEVTVTGACTISVYVENAHATENRNIGLYSAAGSYSDLAAGTQLQAVNASTGVKVNFAVSAAGTYYIACPDNALYLYAVAVKY